MTFSVLQIMLILDLQRNLCYLLNAQSNTETTELERACQ